MRIDRKAVLALAFFCGFVISCSGGFPPEFPAAEFKLKSPLTGKEISLSDVRGKPVIIYWFTSW